MRFPLLVLLAGCGLSQGDFAPEFVERYCEAWDACDRVGRPCPVELDGRARYRECDFDRDAAAVCLDATYTCDDSDPERTIVEVPPECLAVCGDGALVGAPAAEE